jgi:hypothetical protein
MDSNEHARLEAQMLDIWFFVGVALLIYGIMIGCAGIYYISNPAPVVLTELNPSLWWGAILTVIGAVYIITSLKRRSGKIRAFDALHGANGAG